MGLREQAAADLKIILEDSAAGFGMVIRLIDPAGRDASLTGFTTDVFQGLDPETGVQVSGRIASVALSIKAIRDAGFPNLPRGVGEQSEKPWIVEFDDAAGVLHRFKVSEAMPDRAIGIITARLEAYK